MNCERCGEPFTPRTVTVIGGPGSPQRFCSRLCGSAARQARLRATNPEKFRAQRKARYDAASEADRKRKRLARFGMSNDDYRRLLDQQGGVCAICRQPERAPNKELAVDHDHRCCPRRESCGRCIRGLLCSRCNPMIGYAGDDAAVLVSAIEYLNRVR